MSFLASKLWNMFGKRTPTCFNNSGLKMFVPLVLGWEYSGGLPGRDGDEFNPMLEGFEGIL